MRVRSGVLYEANQEVPDFLVRLGGPLAGGGCPYCGGLGHGIMECPKLEGERRKQLGAASSTRGEGGD